jgi:hypothetical protein
MMTMSSLEDWDNALFHMLEINIGSLISPFLSKTHGRSPESLMWKASLSATSGALRAFTEYHCMLGDLVDGLFL